MAEYKRWLVPFLDWKGRYTGEAVGNIEKTRMRQDTCDVCRCKIAAGAVLIHNVVPHEVTQQAGLSDSITVKLCISCRNEVEAWYSKRVSNATYDWEIKRFRPKSPTEMVKEYMVAYEVFVKYKRWLLQIT